MTDVRIPTDDVIHQIATRAVAEIIPYQEFVEGLRAGRPLRLKMGFDPTKPVITLGWAVGLRKLRQLQDLGHTVVVIIGDWTARIGDPSGQSQTRLMLSEEEVKANSEAILRQFYKVLDPQRTEIRRQSEWFDRFSLADIVRLAARFTVAQVLQRDDFAQRFSEHRPIGLHEFLYPILQAYDSVAVEANVEFGGTDQKFNNLVGRELQRIMGQKAGPAGQGQAVFLVPLLVGLDGRQKMSQSLGNYIAVDDPPHEMYGKLMSIPDALILDYFELLTDVPEEELRIIGDALQEHSGHPAIHVMNHKLRLAREIVTQFHSREAAREAAEEFRRVFMERGPPENVVEFTMSFRDPLFLRESVYHLPRILEASGLVSSVSEATRLIRQGAVEKLTQFGAEPVHRFLVPLTDRATFRVGKHRFLRIVDADKQ